MLQPLGVLLFLGISYAVPLSENPQIRREQSNPAFILNNPAVVQINTDNRSNISAVHPNSHVTGGANPVNNTINHQNNQLNSTIDQDNSMVGQISPSTSQVNQLAEVHPTNQVAGGANSVHTSINQDKSQVKSTTDQVISVVGQISPSTNGVNQLADQSKPEVNQVNSTPSQDNHVTGQANHTAGQAVPEPNQVNSVNGHDNHSISQINHISGETNHTSGKINNLITNQELVLGQIISEFGLEMCEMIYLNGEQDTVVFSPLSIATLVTLLMAGMGKQSKTYHEIDKLFGYNKANEESIHQLYQKFINESSVQDKNISFAIGNKLFLQGDDEKRIEILGSFTKTAKENYNASIETVDFLNDPFGATNSINEWVKSVTNGKIPQVLAGPLDPQTKFMAVNTVYFKAPWQTPFETLANRISTFNTGREKIDMTFMTQIMDVKIHQLSSEEANATMVEIPYTSERYSMFIIKPKGPPGLGSVLQVEYAINSVDTLVEETKSKPTLPASVQIPRMRISSKTYLKGILEKMGASSLFSPESADFSRITKNNQPILNNMIHEAIIDITEEGTEAAAVTSSLIWKGGTSLSFVLDRPSILFIYDSKTKVPIFWSRLITPESI